MPEREFYRLLKKHGCRWEQRSKHSSIFFGDIYISGFAVAHSKGGKREVKPFYVNQFLKRFKELGL
jgi:hypothetical protein